MAGAILYMQLHLPCPLFSMCACQRTWKCQSLDVEGHSTHSHQHVCKQLNRYINQPLCLWNQISVITLLCEGCLLSFPMQLPLLQRPNLTLGYDSRTLCGRNGIGNDQLMLAFKYLETSSNSGGSPYMIGTTELLQLGTCHEDHACDNKHNVPILKFSPCKRWGSLK